MESSSIKEGSCLATYVTTLYFHIIKVDLNTNTWTRIYEFVNRALFLGHSYSISIEVSDNSFEVSDNSFCQPNCIYFTDDAAEQYSSNGYGGDRHRGGKDMGIYNLGDGSITAYFKGNIAYHQIFIRDIT
ncbi:hypothetical protein Dsin_001535 [Dipteronia sinensis]|uniref:KIB1-4 beta-propeller domain-containing protein n=1 Tax=Dipteronia sinensis TaxID=43782 RepID=A0AAE0B5T6_9ROSI|nr:hypothetical protein Dsin_001535 [Dipteronia sinensis]